MSLLSEKKWFNWIMLFLATPYGIYLLFKNREDYPTFVPFVVGGIFGLPLVVMLFIEDGISLILMYLFVLLLGASIVALIKGNVSSLYLRSRKVAVITLILSFVAIGVIGSSLPEVKETNEATAIQNKTDENDSTSEVDSTEIKEDEVKEKEQNQDQEQESSTKEAEEEPPLKEEETVDSSNQTDNQEDNGEKEEVSPNKSSGDMTVHFVNIGQGSAQVIVAPSGKVMLIDAGNNDDEDDIVAYLNNLGIKRIDYVIGTHPDADHVGGLDAAIRSFEIGEIYMPKISANTITFEDVLQSISDKGLKVRSGTEGINLNMGDGIKTEFLAPIGTSSDRNEMSIVVKLTYGSRSFLFTGDADDKSESEMISKHGNKLDVDVLSVGHHGSDTSSTQSFINKVTPKFSVIQVGKNSYGHPTEEVLQRLSDTGAEIYRNDKQGTIVFATNGQTIDINTNAWAYNAPSTAPEKEPTSPSEEEKTIEEPKEEQKEETKDTQSISATSSISNPNPEQYSSVTVTVSVKDQNGNPVSGANVDLILHYKSKDTEYNGKTDGSGQAVLSFKIGRASTDFTVDGDIVVTANGLTARTTTAFTPK